MNGNVNELLDNYVHGPKLWGERRVDAEIQGWGGKISSLNL